MNENEKPLQGKKLTRPEGVNVIYDEIPYIIDELFNEQAMEDFLQSQKKNFGGMDKKLFRLKERETVQMPLLEDLRKLGWTIINLNAQKQKPQESGRASFDEVFMREELHASLLRLNPWLLPTQADTVIKQLTEAIPKGGLVQDNKEVLNFLLNGMAIQAKTGQTATQYPTVKIIDFDKQNIAKNSFIACAEFKVRIKGTDQHIIPDIVLFVNGLPLVVIECKSIKQNDSIGEGIEQLLRYSEQRGTKEGSRELFKYNQFVVVTNGFDARFGSISSHEEEYFFKWTDPYPYSLNDLPQGASLPSEQTRLVYGMCSHANLLDILKTFVIFRENDKGEEFKVVGRYQQFRAVKKTVERLLEGKTKIEKGGIVWHTQGSGKSLTMHFLVREMYYYDSLKDYKIVFITDRTDLEKQLGQDVSKLGSVRIAENTNQLREYLTQKDSSVVMGMIQKFQEKDLEVFPELNTSPKILVMIDEAHRTQYQRLGANLDKALPNAVRIAFTGTPIEKTKQTFGDYIDKYTMRQAVEDKVTLRIVYEGRTAEVEIKDKDAANRRFRDVFKDYDNDELSLIVSQTRSAYLNSEVLIAEKAKDMVQHYIANIFDNGFKAQIVACSREATATYKRYVDIALKEKIKDIEKKTPKNPHLPRLRKLRAEVIISSAGVNDKLTAYTDATKQAEYIASFKRPFDSSKGGEVGILIVTSMLLVGFDAPVEQVLYLDKVIREHTLLQTIARVNRIASNDVGYIVDYVGVANHLKDALSNYSEEELQEAGLDKGLQEIDVLLRELKESSKAMQDFFAKNGIENLDDIQAMYDMFYDEDIRFEFVLLFKKFTSLLNQLYPKKEALAFMQEMEQYSTINALAYQYSRDKRMSMRGIPEKLRLVIDAFLLTKGINIKVEPIEILDEKFTQEIAKYQDLKTKTEAIQHATRTYIEDNTETDPELYASFAEELEAILIEFQNNWEELYKRLEELRKKMKYHEQTEPAYGLNRKTQMPFFRTLKQEFFPNKEPNEDQISVLVKLTQDIYYLCKGEQVNVDYWENIMKQSATKRKLQEKLIAYKNFLPIDIKKIETLNSRLMEKAKKRHDAIQYTLD
jgi:type I restriction enzyme R subunit